MRSVTRGTCRRRRVPVTELDTVLDVAESDAAAMAAPSYPRYCLAKVRDLANVHRAGGYNSPDLPHWRY
jgi:hypothetical protein